MVETMKWEDGKLILLDQTKLPVSVEWISCDTYQRVGKAIQKLEVRGAPAIGAAAAFAMVLAWRKIVEKVRNKKGCCKHLQYAAANLCCHALRKS